MSNELAETLLPYVIGWSCGIWTIIAIDKLLSMTIWRDDD